MQPYWNKGPVDMHCNDVSANGPFTDTAKADNISDLAEIKGQQRSSLNCSTCDSAIIDSDTNWVEEDRLQQQDQPQLFNSRINESKYSSTRDCISDDPEEPSNASSYDAAETKTVVSDKKDNTPRSLSGLVEQAALLRCVEFLMGDCGQISDLSSQLLRIPSQAYSKDRTIHRIGSDSQNKSHASSSAQRNNHNMVSKIDDGNQGKTVASGRSLNEIEMAISYTKNNSNQKQRYEMRGGHSVEICSRVVFPDRITRDVTVTVEAIHSNGCHRVIMFKGLTAKKRLDLGPKVKDCRLRMDQIVFTRPNTTTVEWQKSITMSYDSDFQVGLSEKDNKAI